MEKSCFRSLVAALQLFCSFIHQKQTSTACIVLCCAGSSMHNGTYKTTSRINGSKQSVKSNGYKGWRWVSAPPDPVSYLGRKSLTSNSRVAEKRSFRCACISHREQKLWDDCRDETCGPRRFCDGGHMSHTCGPESP